MEMDRKETDRKEDTLEVLKEEFLRELTEDELKLVGGGGDVSENAIK